MAIVYLDQSGNSRQVKVDNWKNKLWDGSWGKYGWWCQFNINPHTYKESVSEEALYAGDGFSGFWHIKFS